MGLAFLFVLNICFAGYLISQTDIDAIDVDADAGTHIILNTPTTTTTTTTTATTSKRKSKSKSLRSDSNRDANPAPVTVTTLTAQRAQEEPTLPKWILDYISWHQEMRAKFPGKAIIEDPNAPPVLVRTCLVSITTVHMISYIAFMLAAMQIEVVYPFFILNFVIMID